jgi:ABC-type antimicrobial peptide transport system permease subunit
MTESILLSIIALTIGVGLFFLLKPEFLSLRNVTAGSRAMFLLDIRPIHLFYFFIFTLAIGSLAGFFPSLFLSKLKASALFNDASKIKMFSGVSVRQTLITIQIAL